MDCQFIRGEPLLEKNSALATGPGLCGVKLVITGDHEWVAAPKMFSATHWRCRVHWLRTSLPTCRRVHFIAVHPQLDQLASVLLSTPVAPATMGDDPVPAETSDNRIPIPTVPKSLAHHGTTRPYRRYSSAISSGNRPKRARTTPAHPRRSYCISR